MTTQADALIKASFPNLQDNDYEVTSPQTREYNCIAWAADDMENWWWPSADDHWPDGVPRVNTVDNFILAFQRLGYDVCDDGALQVQFEKVALYANANALSIWPGSSPPALGPANQVQNGIFNTQQLSP